MVNYQDKLQEAINDPTIKTLDLSVNNIGTKGIAALAELLKDTQITELNLGHNKIGKKEVEVLAQVLKDTQITKLNLYGNNIEDEGAIALARVLQDTQITELNLHGNNIEGEGGEVLAQALKGTQITKFSLYSNEIRDEGAIAFARVLQDTQITELNLGSNNIESEGAIALAGVLQDTQITKFDLSSNFIEDEGAIALARILKDTQITKLSLGYNKIGNEGAIVLAEVLKGTEITKFDLSSNFIEDKGAIALARVLQDTQITELNLGGNKIGNKGTIALARILKDTQITELDLSMSINREVLDKVTQALDYNRDFARKLCKLFQELVVENKPDKKKPKMLEFNFNAKSGSEDESDNVDDIGNVYQAINLIKTITERPNSIVHIINNKDIPYTKEQIEGFVKQISQKFSEALALFMEHDLTSEQYIDDHEHYMNILSKCKEPGLQEITKAMLDNRPLLYIPNTNNIVEPYAIILLSEYKMDIVDAILRFNNVQKVTESLEYYVQHKELNATEAIDILCKRSLEYYAQHKESINEQTTTAIIKLANTIAECSNQYKLELLDTKDMNEIVEYFQDRPDLFKELIGEMSTMQSIGLLI